MIHFSRRSLIAVAMGTALAAATAARAADKPSEIRIDWATYNPVSMLLKDGGSWKRSSPRTASAFAGCSRSAPTRRWNS